MYPEERIEIGDEQGIDCLKEEIRRRHFKQE
jgi:hypothetical protein